MNNSSAIWPLTCARRNPQISIAAPSGAAKHRRDNQCGKEADVPADVEGEIGADHIDAGMGEIQHAHHAEDQRQPARQHEQQHAVDEAVEQRDKK